MTPRERARTTLDISVTSSYIVQILNCKKIEVFGASEGDSCSKSFSRHQKLAAYSLPGQISYPVVVPRADSSFILVGVQSGQRYCLDVSVHHPKTPSGSLFTSQGCIQDGPWGGTPLHRTQSSHSIIGLLHSPRAILNLYVRSLWAAIVRPSEDSASQNASLIKLSIPSSISSRLPDQRVTSVFFDPFIGCLVLEIEGSWTRGSEFSPLYPRSLLVLDLF